jgi:hypothetical protein
MFFKIFQFLLLLLLFGSSWGMALEGARDGWKLAGGARSSPKAENSEQGVAVLWVPLWGLDLGRIRHAAGGVGGLLAVTLHRCPNVGQYTAFCHGNANVLKLVKTANQTTAAVSNEGVQVICGWRKFAGETCCAESSPP